MTEQIKAFGKSNVVKTAKTIVDTFYFLLFAYGLYQFSLRAIEVGQALDLIAKK